MSKYDLVKQVSERQSEPFYMEIQIDGLDIHPSVKQLIVNHYHGKFPFGLGTDDFSNTVYFFPSHGCAIWCDDGQVTLNTFQNQHQFRDCIKVALVAHRKFIGGRQLDTDEKYQDIIKQLTSI